MTRSSDLGSAFAAATGGDFGLRQDLGGHGESGVVISDPALLFSGRFRQAGDDLVIHREFQSVTIHDYFRHAKRPVLYAPDGSSLSPDVVDAITEERHGPLIAGQQPPRGDAIGRVEQASGGATVIRDGMVVALHAGDLVFKGDAVQTDDHGALAILFIDGTAFNLSASARMVLNEMVYQAGGVSNSSLLSVVQGSISFVAGNIAHTGDMKVDTPVATMGIRGTAVHVVSPDHGPTRFSVMREPDGRVGRYVLYDRQDPTRVIGTLSDVNEIIEVQLADGQVVVRTLPKTPEELSQERDLTGEVFHIFRIGQDHPLSDALHAPSQSGGSPEFLAPEGAGPSQNPAPFGGQNVPFQAPPVPSPPAPPTPLFPPLVLAPLVIVPVADASPAVTYGTTSVVATGQSAMDTPILVSRGGRRSLRLHRRGLGWHGPLRHGEHRRDDGRRDLHGQFGSGGRHDGHGEFRGHRHQPRRHDDQRDGELHRRRRHGCDLRDRTGGVQGRYGDRDTDAGLAAGWRPFRFYRRGLG